MKPSSRPAQAAAETRTTSNQIGAPSECAQILEVGDDVRRVREEEEPERAGRPERDAGGAAPKSVVHAEREPHGIQARKGSRPARRSRVAAVGDAHGDHRARRGREAARGTRGWPGAGAHRSQVSAPLRRKPFRVARKAVVGDRLPLGRVRHELPVARPDARVLVEGAHPDARDLLRVRANAPERRAAGRAERLRESVLGLVRADELLAGRDSMRSGHDSSLRRGSGAGASLATRAVAVARRDRRLGHFEPNPSAETATGEQALGHGRSLGNGF